MWTQKGKSPLYIVIDYIFYCYYNFILLIL